MKNLDKVGATILLVLGLLVIYSVFSFRHDFITKDVTLVASANTSKYSAKYQHKIVYNEELGYNNPEVGDTVVVRIFTDDNPWYDGYFYQIVSPKEMLQNLTVGKKLIDNKDTVYQYMHITSVNNNDLSKIFN